MEGYQDQAYRLSCLQVLKCQQAASGDTTKLLIQLQDGMQVEAVVMHYDTTGAIGSSCSMIPHMLLLRGMKPPTA